MLNFLFLFKIIDALPANTFTNILFWHFMKVKIIDVLLSFLDYISVKVKTACESYVSINQEA